MRTWRPDKDAEKGLLSDTPSGYSPIVNDHAFLPKRICGPLITVSNRASGAIQIAETSPMRLNQNSTLRRTEQQQGR